MFRYYKCCAQMSTRGVRMMSSSTPLTPPILPQIKKDLMAAMRAKDTMKSNVLRAIIAETTNASKTNTPYSTDIQLKAFLMKRSRTARETAKEFAASGRDDLVQKETAEADVFESYAEGIQTLSSEDVTAALKATVEEIKAKAGKVDLGSLIKAAMGAGGSLEGKPVERSKVAELAKKLVSEIQG